MLYDHGYTYLDVRSTLENEEVGKVKGAVNVPFVLAKKVYSPQENKKVGGWVVCVAGGLFTNPGWQGGQGRCEHPLCAGREGVRIVPQQGTPPHPPPAPISLKFITF